MQRAGSGRSGGRGGRTMVSIEGERGRRERRWRGSFQREFRQEVSGGGVGWWQGGRREVLGWWEVVGPEGGRRKSGASSAFRAGSRREEGEGARRAWYTGYGRWDGWTPSTYQGVVGSLEDFHRSTNKYRNRKINI